MSRVANRLSKWQGAVGQRPPAPTAAVSRSWVKRWQSWQPTKELGRQRAGVEDAAGRSATISSGLSRSSRSSMTRPGEHRSS